MLRAGLDIKILKLFFQITSVSKILYDPRMTQDDLIFVRARGGPDPEPEISVIFLIDFIKHKV